jgi:hypothetical protein
MKKFDLAATRGMPVIASASGRPTTRKGLLARIIEALHESRRLEAARVIHRSRHLIAEDFFERPTIAATSHTTEESNANADRDNSRADADRRAFQDA